MMRIFVAVVLVLVASSAYAQDCTPAYMVQSTYWSSDPNSRIIGDSNNAHIFSQPVPAGQVWKMRSISLSTMYGGAAEYMLEWLVAVPGGNHYHEIARGVASGTPALHIAPADAAAMVMQPGERLAGRVNGDASSFPGIALYFSGWTFPIACLPRLLGVEPTTVTVSGGSSVDLEPLRQALQQVADAAAAAVAAVP